MSITKIYKDYKTGGGILSYDIYHQQVKKKNISFTKLGHEECECLEHKTNTCKNEEIVIKEMLSKLISSIENTPKNNNTHTHKKQMKYQTEVSAENGDFCLKYKRHLIAVEQLRKSYEIEAQSTKMNVLFFCLWFVENILEGRDR